MPSAHQSTCAQLAYPLPSWVPHWLKTQGQALIDTQQGHLGYMSMVIELAQLNYTKGPDASQGGPFAAAVVHRPSGRVVSLGMNRVIALDTATAHAEIIALTNAQQTLGCYSLRDQTNISDSHPYTLYTSAQMCAMCLGAVCWSGVGQVVFGATAEDTERFTGFDEGPIHPAWRQELEKRGIMVIGPILAEKANQVLKNYKTQNKFIYAG